MSLQSLESSQSLEDMWAEARARFKLLTGQLLPLDRSASPDDLTKALEARIDQKNAISSPELAKAKDAGLSILSCIKLLGGVVAQGASTVFGPADLCFNAVSMLLDVPKRISDFHDAIGAVFDEVAPTLSQFKIYSRVALFDNVDEGLKLAIHKVLISFVDICAKCINIEYGGRWNRAKAHAKRLLCDDKSVEEELAKFKNLVQSQQYVQNAVTLEAVLSGNRQLAAVLTKAYETGQQITVIETGVKALVEAEGNRKSDATRRDQLEKIKMRLGITEDATDNPKAVYEDMLKRSVTETGQWLGSNTPYCNWADKHRASTGAILHLTGPPSTGKSFTLSAIISRLKSEHSSPGSPDRALVAYYFFSSVLTSKNDNEKGPAAESALKWISLQLAEQDAAYAKLACDACVKPGRDDNWLKKASCMELWTTLRIGQPSRKATHYVLLDGLDNLSRPATQQLFDIFRMLPAAAMEMTQPCPVRVILCGKPETFDAELIQLKAWPVIKMEENMAADMRKYVQHELGSLFPGRKSQERRASLENKLLEQSASTYRSMRNTLDAVRKLFDSTGTEEQLDVILARDLRDPTVILREELERLEVQLSARQIDLLNELLVWVIFELAYLQVEELEAALKEPLPQVDADMRHYLGKYLRFKETLLQGLRDFLDKNLSKVFTIDPLGRVLAAAEVEDIVVKQRDVPRNMPERPKISLDIKITNADMTTVQRFLWDLSRHATLDNFGFRDGTAKFETPKSSIMVNEVDAHLAIVKSAVSFLRAPPDPKTEAIGRYLVRFLPDHLEVVRAATGLDSVGSDDKKTISKFVFDLFDDPDIIQRHWSVSGDTGWYGNADSMAVILGWLLDETVVGSLNLSKNDMAWLDGIKKARNPGRKLLDRVMRMVATTWLRERTGEARDAFYWIRGFLCLEVPAASDDAGSNQPSAQTRIDDDDEGAAITLNLYDPDDAQVEAAEKWCRAALRLAEEDLDSLWFERLGSTYASLYEHAAAVKAFNQAKLRPSPSWDVFEGLATSLSEQNNLRGACAALKLALEGQSPEAAVEVETEQRATAYRRLADWHYELREPDEAIQFSKKAHDLCPDDALHQYNLLKYYVLFGRDDEARALVVEAARNAGLIAATGQPMSRLGLFLQHVVGVERFSKYPPLHVFNRILALVAETDCISILLDDIKAAVDSAREEERHYQRSALLICQGVAQFHHHQLAAAQGGGGSDDSADQQLREALSSWRESCVVAQNNLYQQSSWFVADICELATWLASWHLFDDLRKLMGGGSSVDLAAAMQAAHDTAQQETSNALKESATGIKKSADQLDGEIRTRVAELESLALQHKQPGRISAAQCYLASYYAVHGQVPKAREIFVPDMATVLAMLSDGDQSNNSEAFSMVYYILLHTGDDVNALTATLLIPRDLPRQHLKDVLAEVLAGSGATQTNVEKEVVEKMLSLLEMDALKDELDVNQAVLQLQIKVKELYSAEPEMQQQEEKESHEDSGQEPREKPEDTVDEVEKEREKEKTPHVQAYEAATEILERFATVLGSTWSYTCDGCYTKTWDFDNVMHACRFCHDVGFCQMCLEALQAPGGHRVSKGRQMCGPDHEWLTLPRWDAKRWAETFAKTVRVPRIRAYDGSLVDARSTEGDYDVVSASSWLGTIVDDWGLKQEDWDF